MAETLRELVVALSLDSSNFSRNMRTINQQIKEAEPTFRLAGAGVENYEKTIAGTEAKLSMLGNKLTQQQRAVEQYSRVLVAANPRRPQRLTKLEGQVKALQKAMQNSADAVSKAQTDLNNARAAVKDTEAEIRRLTEQLYRMRCAHRTGQKKSFTL